MDTSPRRSVHCGYIKRSTVVKTIEIKPSFIKVSPGHIREQLHDACLTKNKKKKPVPSYTYAQTTFIRFNTAPRFG
jgi:hypothetical protein